MTSLRTIKTAAVLLLGSTITLTVLSLSLDGASSPPLRLEESRPEKPSDIVGDLGGLKVLIPSYYVTDVEYDQDPGFGEKRSQPRVARTSDSRLRSFGMEVRFPDMTGLAAPELKQENARSQLDPRNPWIHIGINAGEIYPKLGAYARAGRAQKLWETSEHWWNNYDRGEDVHGLESYLPSGIDPRTGNPARESDSTVDVYIHRSDSGHVDTYIWCGRTSVPSGIARCHLEFGLEPAAEVAVRVSFYPLLLSQWKGIRDSVEKLLLGFEQNRSSGPV